MTKWTLLAMYISELTPTVYPVKETFTINNERQV
jgi:hypothetical protein